ncbi:MAG: hypothetical protein K0Q72_381 [Armatimonadetes bacterium]|jgi:putative nucleotidyltransferase with HDIG domain|nr:hypothetical protein [Armatimonadota bacterium]
MSALPSAVAGDAITVSLAEVLGALSYALDLTEGLPPGHSLRTCAIGMRLATELDLDAGTRSALYYALLLKDAGCSSNSAQTADLFGSDEHVLKRELKTTDWSHKLEAARYVFRTAALGCSLADRVRHVVKVAVAPGGAAAMFRIRCERGAGIVRQLGFPEATAEAVYALDEHWDGQGNPHGTRGDAIPLLARIAGLAQTVEVFVQQAGVAQVLEMVRARSGTWFDPKLAELVAGWTDSSWWAQVADAEVMTLVRSFEPEDLVRCIDGAGLDEVCAAFAEIIDAKSPYTYRHSSGVAAFAGAIGGELGLDEQRLRDLHRAGLLHDIGKLGVSNRILDKPGALTPGERMAVQDHPRYTFEILSRVTAFRGLAELAANHHERLDGSGYPWGKRGGELTADDRILAVADVYEALTADRPYRKGMPEEEALGILRREAGTLLDAECVTALEASLGAVETIPDASDASSP